MFVPKGNNGQQGGGTLLKCPKMRVAKEWVLLHDEDNCVEQLLSATGFKIWLLSQI